MAAVSDLSAVLCPIQGVEEIYLVPLSRGNEVIFKLAPKIKMAVEKVFKLPFEQDGVRYTPISKGSEVFLTGDGDSEKMADVCFAFMIFDISKEPRPPFMGTFIEVLTHKISKAICPNEKPIALSVKLILPKK